MQDDLAGRVRITKHLMSQSNSEVPAHLNYEDPRRKVPMDLLREWYGNNFQFLKDLMSE